MPPKPKKQEGFDNAFYVLAGEVTRAIEKNKDGSSQKEQVEELLLAEKLFKEAVLKYKQSTQVYKKFLQKVCVQNKNILSARPYFREGAITFSKKITPAIKDNNIEALKKFNINYQLIKFIRDSWLGPFPKKAEQLYNRVHKARTILIENNMPLAINRAKLFYRKTPKSHLSLIDMIGVAAMGLSSGVDKFVGSYSRMWVGVSIGRITGNLIDAYSETTLHFFPAYKRILYKANSIRGRQGIVDVKELTEAVNKSFQQDKAEGKSVPKENVTTSELHSLMSAASIVSADATVNDEGYGVYQYTMDSSQNIEEAIIGQESANQMLSLIKKLPIIQRKILRLKGIKV